MKVQLYHEALAPEFVRFTLIGIQFNRDEETREWYLSIGFMGGYITFIL